MYDYLTTFRTKDNEHLCIIYRIKDIAELVACAAEFGDTDIRVWRVLPNQEPQRMTIHHEHKSHIVWLTDRYGNEIESARFEQE